MTPEGLANPLGSKYNVLVAKPLPNTLLPPMFLPLNGDYRAWQRISGLERPARQKAADVEIQERKRVGANQMKQNEWGEARMEEYYALVSKHCPVPFYHAFVVDGSVT